jgi:glycosyltransferase involved in cell wall biosynthesis
MKVAMLVPYAIFLPDEGGRIRAYNLLKQLARQHEMLLLTPASPANASCDLPVRLIETGPPGRRRQIASPSMYRRLSAIVREERPDVLLVEFPWGGLHAAILSRRHGIPFVLDAHNVEGDRFGSGRARIARVVSLYERIVARAAARVWAVSDHDRARFIAKGVRAEKIDVVPNGFDPDVMRPDATARARVRTELGIGDGTRMLLFFGQLDYAPNREALAVIAREIAPRLARAGGDYRIIIAGKGGPSRLASGRSAGAGSAVATYVGAVPEIAPYINAADVVLGPLTSGGGTRLKVLESIACGTPVVSTAAGAEGIDRSVCGDLLTVADGWDAFVEAISAVSAPASRNVPAPFIDMYSWAHIAMRVRWPEARGGRTGR